MPMQAEVHLEVAAVVLRKRESLRSAAGPLAKARDILNGDSIRVL
jgi:hypothetical protein